MTATWHELAFKIRNQPARALHVDRAARTITRLSAPKTFCWQEDGFTVIGVTSSLRGFPNGILSVIALSIDFTFQVPTITARRGVRSLWSDCGIPAHEWHRPASEQALTVTTDT